MKYRQIADIQLCFLFIIAIFSCSSDLVQEPDGGTTNVNDGNPLPSNEIIINVDSAISYQTIEHFGASDAWSCQFVGNWPLPKKQAIADLLFSLDMDSGNNPKGIGLSLWRFNIGAGSSEQGLSSDISDEWRRAESFLLPDGTYDWSKQSGQVWFAQAAKAKGVDKLLLFSNSPPVHITKNGLANTNDGEVNLDSNEFAAFGDFLANVVDGMQKNFGLTVDYISPINEPQWEWKNGQEGCPYFNDDIANVVRALNNSLVAKNLSTSIDVAEAGQINFLYEPGDKGDRGNQISAFFDPGSTNYIGNLSNMGNAISGHGYFTTYPFANLLETRQLLGSSIKSVPGLKYWMSEYTILEDNPEIKGTGRDLGIDPALYMARVIHTDLEVAQASAWHWWLAVSPYDYKDGLVYVDFNKHDGNFYQSKMLWGLGNYSRFIRPGYKRIKSELLSDGSTKTGSSDENFLFSAYKDPDSSKIVVVIVNSYSSERDIKLQNKGSMIQNASTYVTSASSDLENHDLGNGGIISIPGKSIVTIQID